MPSGHRMHNGILFSWCEEFPNNLPRRHAHFINFEQVEYWQYVECLIDAQMEEYDDLSDNVAFC